MLCFSKKIRIAVAAGTAAFIGYLWILASENDPSLAHTSAGPKRVGQMQSFEMMPSLRLRPTVAWKNAAGQEVSLANFSGKVVMLNFWASWCSPCLRELPSINRLQARLGGDQFTVVALNVDRGGKSIASRYTRKLNLDKLDLYWDQDNTTAKSMKLQSMPTTIIFDAKGREVGRVVGSAEWDTKEAVDLLQWFINNPGHADQLPPEAPS
ncbi:MAG: TlpA disulfide reductase family protein [Rhodospirillales bacterium]|nr:TlpA disulfide reductase family protein [Rhodospirillales bacterium]